MIYRTVLIIQLQECSQMILRLSSLNMGQLFDDIERIFHDQNTVFKLNLSFGCILFNNETEQMQ